MLTRLLTVIVCAHPLFLAVALVHAETARLSQQATHDQNTVVTLRVLARDHHGNPISDLAQNELEVYEGKNQQTVESLSRSQEARADIGFLIDISVSQRNALSALASQDAAALAVQVVRTGDFAFVGAFARDRALLLPLTSDLGQVKNALSSAFNAGTRPGGTSLSDTVLWACTQEFQASSTHAALIIFSDMADNRSNHTAAEAVAQAQRSGVVIYPVTFARTAPGGPLNSVERLVDWFADDTGGESFDAYFRPLEQVLRAIRTDLDSTYVIAYKPESPGPASVKVRCKRKGVKLIAPEHRY